MKYMCLNNDYINIYIYIYIYTYDFGQFNYALTLIPNQ